MSIEALTPIFRAALDQWEQADCGGGRRTGLHTEILPLRNQCIESSYFVNGRNVSSVMFVQSGWTSARQHDARAYAVTLVWHDPRTGEILDGDMELNEERSIGGQLINYGVCPDSGCTGSTVDLRNIVTHELGHYFGLAHTPDDREATMWESAEPNEVKKRDLQPDDVAGICGIYPAGDLTGACDITPDNGLGLSCSTSGTNCDSNGLGSNGFACSSSCTRPDDFSIACAGAAASRPAYCGSVSNLGGTPCASTKKCGCRIQDRASEPGTLFASMSFAFLAFVFLRKQKRR